MAEDTDRKYLLQAYSMATHSLDPSTQNGAVVVTQRNDVVYGYNRFPPRIHVTDERLSRPLKYEYIEHAERNVIYKCVQVGIATGGATMYVPWFACVDCARAIIQAGIVRVVGHQRMADETPERWKASIATALGMLDEAGVDVTMVDGVIGGPRIRFNGEWWEP